MIDPVNANQIQDLFAKPSKVTNPTETGPNNGADATLEVDYDSLIKEVTQIPQTDAQAVQQAKELLASGELENPQNIRQAAENIVDLGI